MKVGIFIDNFFEAQEFKDPGVIAESLLKLGYEVKIYCFNTNSKKFGNIDIKKITKENSQEESFWKEESVDAVIVYSWLSLRFSNLIKTLNSVNIKTFLKLDSDGHLLYPLRPTYLRTIGRDNTPKELLIHFIRLIQWFVFPKLITRKRLDQLSISNASIIESPAALDNLRLSLKYWKQEKLNDKLFSVPDPVSQDIIDDSHELAKKENIIFCNGRWNDKQKNTSGLIKVLTRCNLGNWKIVIIGKNSSIIKEKLKTKNKNINIEAFENVEHKLIGEYLRKSKIIFAPSNHESFNLAVAESLCYGCSLAGTPLESFLYFSQNGKYGTISKNFKILEITKALINEIRKWDNNFYNPEEVSKYWRSQLSPEHIGRSIDTLLKKYEN